MASPRDHTTWQTHFPNETFRIGYVPLPPYHTPPDKSGIVGGTWGRMLTSILHSLEMNPKWILPTDGFFGHKNPDGTFVGQWGLVIYNHSDVTLGPWPKLAMLMDDATPSATNEFSTVDFFAVIPDLFASNQVSFNLMDRYVGGLMLLSMCTIALVTQLALKLHTGKYGAGRVWWMYLRTLTLEPTILPYSINNHATRIMLGVWTFVLLVISQGINSDLKTSLILQTPAKRLQLLQEIADIPDFKPFIGTILLPLFMGDQRSSMEVIAARANDMGSLINADMLASKEVFREIEKGRAATMMTPSMMKSSLPHVCPVVRPGYIYRVEEPVASFEMVFYFRKDYDLNKQLQINKRIIWLRETPYPWHRESYIEDTIKDAASSLCFASGDRFRQTFSTVESTSLNDILPIAYLYGIAVISCMSAFIIELSIYFCERCSSNKGRKRAN